MNKTRYIGHVQKQEHWNEAKINKGGGSERQCF